MNISKYEKKHVKTEDVLYIKFKDLLPNYDETRDSSEHTKSRIIVKFKDDHWNMNGTSSLTE